MADLSTNPGFSLISPVTGLLSRIGNFLVDLAEGSAKAQQMNALMALSDADLAERGLKRTDIARYVFRDTPWA